MDDTPTLAYAALPDRLVIWVTRPGQPVRMLVKNVGRDWLSAQVDAFVDALRRNDHAQAAPLGESLFQLLLGPAISLENDRLRLVPDGPLHRLPFGALADSPSGRFAVERWTLTIGTTIEPRSAVSRVTPLRLAAVGDPAVSELAPLPEARKEVEEISRHYPHAVVLTGSSAGARPFLQALESADVLHFGGHTVVNPARPLLSRLVLAPEGAEKTGDLFVYDLERLNLDRLRLAVLASCRAADSRGAAGDGVVSLASAFLSVGVDTVVASLFDIGDQSARDLFVGFHDEYRRTGDPAAALRAAQLRQIRRGRVPTRDWAGVLTVQR
jgi:CHAT domain-containing protein